MQENKILFHISSYRKPQENLALEEYLVHTVPPAAQILLLYRNDPSIIIGKHQNPWKECDTTAALKNGIGIFRRISGGGTVFHDEGNLNYSFILERNKYSRDIVYKIILDALAEAGVHAEQKNKSDIVLDGNKISGNSFYFSKNRILHHGTLLVNTDLSKIKDLLTPRNTKYTTKAVASIPSPVENISEKYPHITFELLQKKIINSAKKMIHGVWEPLMLPETSDPHYSSILDKHISKEWVYSHTPPFDISFREITENNTIVSLSITKGRISGIECKKEIRPILETLLIECEYNRETIISILKKSSQDFPEKDDLITVICNKIF